MTTSIAKPTRAEAIRASLDKKVAGSLTINRESGGLVFASMSEVMEFAKVMSLSQQAVPPHCREQVGICLGITIQAVEWRMSPYAVASKSYIVNDRISYESQLIHAVIEQRAPIRGRLRHDFSGAGDKRRCRVWGIERETGEELSHTSPEFGAITPKNSPLWKSKPDIQLYYNTSRDWARIYFPDVILGVYADDELQGIVTSHGAPPPAGVQGLKNRLLEIEQERESEVEDAIAQPAVNMDSEPEPGEEEQDTSPSAPTPEELAEQQRERKGELFEKSEEYR
jgi:hypothetical protein